MAEVAADGRAAAQLSEAQSELMDACEEQFAQLEKLQNEIILCEPDFCENPQEQSIKRLIATEAELKQWLTTEPRLLAENSEILLEAGKEQMHKLCSELEMVASCYEAKTDKLKETKELELKWLEEKKQVLAAATGHIERLQIEKEKLSEHTVLQDIKEKIQKMKVYQERLMECLGYILEKHVPLPQDDSSTSKKKKNVAHEIHENLISLNEILEVTRRCRVGMVLRRDFAKKMEMAVVNTYFKKREEHKILMNKTLNTPHDPYVAIDDTFWPPYVEMLLRYGIAVRHQENNFKIRLETFF